MQQNLELSWEISDWAKKYQKNSGILQLMNDLGKLNPKEYTMLGGGTPSYIKQVNDYFNEQIKRLSQNTTYFNEFPFKYSSPQGNEKFRDVLANYFSSHFKTTITAKNITLTSGSQNSFYALFNFFSGTFNGKKGGNHKKILFPMVPEYIGYQDIFFEPGSIITCKPKLAQEGDFFKYEIDFDEIEAIPNPQGTIGAVALSIPCNPSGNVLRAEEIDRLVSFTKKNNLPLIFDNAYGLPFPGLVYTDNTPFWDENIIHSFSFSKIGLPGIRTGGIIAREEIGQTLAGYNAIANLSPPTMGIGILQEIFVSHEINELRDDFIRPFYLEKRKQALEIFNELKSDLPIYLHRVEGSFFLWIWFKGLKIGTLELYQKLKQEKVIVIPGEYFFYDRAKDWKDWQHSSQCIRVHFGVQQDDLKQGLEKVFSLAKKYL